MTHEAIFNDCCDSIKVSIEIQLYNLLRYIMDIEQFMYCTNNEIQIINKRFIIISLSLS